MTWLYVESNFVLELAFAQGQSEYCTKLLDLGEADAFDLAIPAYCLTEPFETLGRRHKDRQVLQERLQQELGQLRRTADYGDAVRQVDAATELFIRSRVDERQRLEEVTTRVTNAAEMIPLTADTLSSAFGFSGRLDLSLQDSLVLASVLQHRRDESAAGVFVTRNSKDFDDPDVRQLLTDAGCDLETSFGAVVGRFMA